MKLCGWAVNEQPPALPSVVNDKVHQRSIWSGVVALAYCCFVEVDF